MANLDASALHTHEPQHPRDLDLTIVETQSELAFLLLVILGTILILTLVTVFSFFQEVTSTTFRLFNLPCYVYYGIHLLRRHLGRHRLRKRGDSVKHLSIPPMSMHGLLQFVAARPALMEMVNVKNTRQATLPEGFPSLSLMRSLFGLSLTAFLFLAGTMLFRGTFTTSLAFQAASAIPIALFSAVAISRMRTGFDRYGLGSPSSDSKEPHATFSAVYRATIKWDRLLGLSYLSLEADGVTTRYYNPTGDPLYLLRLLKYRMPDADLIVDERNAGTS